MSQVERIVEALKKGDKPNHFFPTIMGIMNYTGRISDARVKGHVIKSYKKDANSNTVWYHYAGHKLEYLR